MAKKKPDTPKPDDAPKPETPAAPSRPPSHRRFLELQKEGRTSVEAHVEDLMKRAIARGQDELARRRSRRLAHLARWRTMTPDEKKAYLRESRARVRNRGKKKIDG